MAELSDKARRLLDEAYLDWEDKALDEYIAALECVARVARALRMRSKPLSMSEDEFWSLPKINSYGSEELTALHVALRRLDGAGEGNGGDER